MNLCVVCPQLVSGILGAQASGTVGGSIPLTTRFLWRDDVTVADSAGESRE